MYLHQIGVPGISADAQVVIAEVFPGRLAEDVSCKRRQQRRKREVTGRHRDSGLSGGDGASSRYFDARTNRPDIIMLGARRLYLRWEREEFNSEDAQRRGICRMSPATRSGR